MQNQNELTDGKLYEKNDMAKLECGDCSGCCSCCEGMGTSIVLNPYDIWMLEKHLKKGFDELLHAGIELNMAEGMILPNLKMTGSRKACAFLSEEKRCTIHGFRPGICRLFPLGRQYGEQEIRYILLKDGCRKENRTKVKIKKWLGMPELDKNEAFLIRWHGFQKKVQQFVLETEDEDMVKELNLYLLQLFYRTEYPDEAFYETVEERICIGEKLLAKLY